VSPAEPAPTPFAYEKLPGDFRGVFRRNSLWLAPDHLLLVDSSRFSETYKRFYLRDIQTVIVRKTPRFVIPYYWLVLAGVAVLTLVAGLAPMRHGLLWFSGAVLAGIAGYLYFASMFQSCACHLVTRVNRVELPSLFRLSAARRFIEIVTPRIHAAQGELPPDWINRSTTLEELSTAPARGGEAPVPLLATGQFSWITFSVFVLVLADAALTWQQLRTNDAGSLSSLNMLNMVALAVCATISIVQLTRSRSGRVLRALVLAGLLVVAAVTYGSMLLQSIDQQVYHRTFENVLQYIGMRPLAIAEIVADVAIAVPGLLLASVRKRGAS